MRRFNARVASSWKLRKLGWFGALLDGVERTDGLNDLMDKSQFMPDDTRTSPWKVCASTSSTRTLRPNIAEERELSPTVRTAIEALPLSEQARVDHAFTPRCHHPIFGFGSSVADARGTKPSLCITAHHMFQCLWSVFRRHGSLVSTKLQPRFKTVPLPGEDVTMNLCRLHVHTSLSVSPRVKCHINKIRQRYRRSHRSRVCTER